MDNDSEKKVIEKINSINDQLNKMKEAVKETARESDNVKNGIFTEKEELEDPDYQFYNLLIDTNQKIFSDPAIQKAIIEIGKRTDPEVSQLLTQLIGACISLAVNNGIQLYDDMLSKTLGVEIQLLYDVVNNRNADINAMQDVIKIHTQKLQELETTNNINEVEKDLGIDNS